MATIASLLVSLGMNSASFEKETKRARATADGLVNSLGAGFAAGGVAGGIGLATDLVSGFASAAASAAQSVSAMVLETIDQADAAGDLADQLGHDVLALTRLQYAARLTDTELESLTTGLKKLQVNLGKALAGGKADDVFEKLGLDPRRLAALKVDEAFGEIGDAINQLGTDAEKASAIVAIFGKSGIDLANTLTAGSAAIRELGQGADRVGYSIDELEKQRIGKAAEAIEAMKLTAEGLQRTLAIELTPAISATVKELEEFVSGSGSTNTAIKETVAVIGELASHSMDQIQAFYRSFKVMQLGITEGLTAGAKAWQLHAHAIDDVQQMLGAKSDTAFIDGLVSDLEATSRRLAAETAGALSEESWVKQIQDRIAAQERALAGEAGKNAPALSAAMELQEELAASTAEADKEANRLRERANQLLDAAMTKEERFLEMEREIADLYERKLITQAEANKLWEKAAADAEEITKAAEQSPMAKLGEQLREKALTPFQRGLQDMKNILAAVEAGELSAEQGELLRLQGQRDWLEAQQDMAAAGDPRPAALLRGSSAAFSASFGANPVAKKQDELIRIEQQILEIMRRLDAQAGVKV